MWVKICGITNEEDALAAAALGADAVGFVFAPSPRQIAPVRAYDIVRRLPPEILTVGVFRDEAPKRVVDICLPPQPAARPAARPGDAPPTRAWVRERVPFVIKAFAAGDPALDEVDELPRRRRSSSTRPSRAPAGSSTGRWPTGRPSTGG